MKNQRRLISLYTLFLILVFVIPTNTKISVVHADTVTPVMQNGQLSIEGNRLVNANKQAIQLKGVSSFGIQYSPQFVNYDSIKYLRDNWGMNVFRVAMYTDGDKGYIFNQVACKAKVEEAINIAQKLGIYVIVDWHMFNNPQTDKVQAKDFFNQISRKYKNSPNVMYEIANEPCGDVTWSRDIKPYANEVIPVIKANSPNAIVIVGSSSWSQNILEPANDPLKFSNIMYTCHFYAGTHGDWLRNIISEALNKNIAIFVTEWGTSDCNGNGGTYLPESQKWVDFMRQNKISWTNWVLDDADATASLLKPGSNPNGGWNDNDLTESGKFVKTAMLENSNVNSGTSTTPNTVSIVDCNKTYKIVSKNTGKLLNVRNSSLYYGVWMEQASDNGAMSQQWKIEDLGSGNYKITSVLSNLSLNGGDMFNGNHIIDQWLYSGDDSQQWNIIKLDNNTYKIVNKKTNLAMKVSGSCEGADVLQSNYTGDGNDQWILSQVDENNSNSQEHTAFIAAKSRRFVYRK